MKTSHFSINGIVDVPILDAQAGTMMINPYGRHMKAPIIGAILAAIVMVAASALFSTRMAAAATDTPDVPCDVTSCGSADDAPLGYMGTTDVPPAGFGGDGVTPNIQYQGKLVGAKNCSKNATCKQMAWDADQYCLGLTTDFYEAFIYLKGSTFMGFKCVLFKF